MGRGNARRVRPEGRTRRPRWLIPVVVLVAVVLVAGFVTSRMATVGTVDVTGTRVLDPAVVREASGIDEGQRMSSVSTGSAASAVSVLPWVDSATVSRHWPSRVEINITEYVAVGVLDDAGTPVVVDREGRQFLRGEAPEGLTPMRVVAGDEAAVRAAAVALAALQDLDPALWAQVTEVAAPADDSVTLRIGSDREVYWGTAERAAEKAEATRVVLTRDGARWNVSNPALPSVRG